MPTPTPNTPPPYLGAVGGSTVDTVTAANGGQVAVNLSLKLVGSVAQVQADWATLLGTTLSATSIISSDV